jgi:hypothetical protein
MNSRVRPVTLALVAAALMSGHLTTAAQPAKTGTIKGRVRLTGKPPGNAIIRMRLDPMCTKVNAGKRVLQESALTSADGGLANVFVRVQGSFPQTPVPTQPVDIDQRGCLYLPRVAGARVGQTLQVRNSDPLLHNVHSVSTGSNSFNVGQPMAGMTYQFRLKDEEIMLRLSCDVHRWMTAYIGVVSHPHFTVSGSEGTFEIPNVPVGNYTIRTWHELYGELAQPVRISAGATTAVNFAYTGTEKGPAAVRDLATPPRK